MLKLIEGAVSDEIFFKRGEIMIMRKVLVALLIIVALVRLGVTLMNAQAKLYIAGCDWMDMVLVFGLIAVLALIFVPIKLRPYRMRNEVKKLRERLERFEHITQEEFALLKKHSYEPTPIFYATYECYIEDCKRSPEERAALKKEGEDYFNSPEGKEMFNKMTGGIFKDWKKE